MSLQVCVLEETAATLKTAEVSLSAVDSDVAVEVDFERETLPALRADERRFLGSCSLLRQIIFSL